MTLRPRILVLRGGAIGDFILTLPALQAVRALWPEAHMELIGYPHIARLGLIGGTVQAVDSLDRAGIARLFSRPGGLDPDLSARIKSFDLALTYLHDPDRLVRDNLEGTGVAQVLYISPVDPPEHAADHLARPLESLALYAAGRIPVLTPAAEARAAAVRRLVEAGCDPARTVCLHPGSGNSNKNWPVDRYFDLASRLQRRGLAPVFLFGEADAAEAAAFRAAPIRMGTHLDVPDLCDLAALVSTVRAFVGNDSGITHLAAAVGIPVVALFGPTDSTRWGPRGTRVTLLHAENRRMENLYPGTVEQVVGAALEAEGL